MEDLDKKYNVCGTMLYVEEISREIMEEWEEKEPKSRELFNFRYGHNYDHLPMEDKKMGYLAMYKMFRVELTTEEENELQGYSYSKANDRERRKTEMNSRRGRK